MKLRPKHFHHKARSAGARLWDEGLATASLSGNVIASRVTLAGGTALRRRDGCCSNRSLSASTSLILQHRLPSRVACPLRFRSARLKGEFDMGIRVSRCISGPLGVLDLGVS